MRTSWRGDWKRPTKTQLGQKRKNRKTGISLTALARNNAASHAMFSAALKCPVSSSRARKISPSNFMQLNHFPQNPPS